jgi:putative ABC transport system permease protein
MIPGSPPVLDTKLRRDLWRNKGLLLAVVAIIALGSGTLIGIVGTYFNLVGARDAFYRRCHMADFWIDVRRAPDVVLPRLEKVPGISRLASRIAKPVIVDLPGVREPLGSLVLSLPADISEAVNTVVLRSGTWFSGDSNDEILVTEKFAVARGLEPGDTVHFLAGGGRKKFRIVGTVVAAEFIYLVPPGALADLPGNYAVFYLPHRVAAETFGMEGAFNQVVGNFDAEGRGAPEAVLAGLERGLESAGVIASTPRALQFSNMTLGSDLAGLQTMAFMLPTIFFGVAALVLNVLMIRLAEQQRTTIGTLKALGYDNRSLFRHFVLFGGAAGLMGGLAGMAVGRGIMVSFTETYAQFYVFPNVPEGLYPWLNLFGVVAAVVVAVAGSVHGVGRVAALDPAEAMRPPAPPVSGAIFLEHLPALWRRLDFRWQMVLRSTFRNRGRTLVALGSAALGSSMVVLAFGALDSMQAMIQFQFTRVVCSDYRLQFSDPVPETAAYDVAGLPAVSSLETVLDMSGAFSSAHGSKRGGITGIEAPSLLTRLVGAGGHALALPPGGLLMSSWLADQLGVEAGDAVLFTPVRGVRRTHALPVAGLLDSLFGMPVYADRRWLAGVLGSGDAITRIDIRGATDPESRDALYGAVKRMPRLEALGQTARDHAAIERQIHAALGSMAASLIIFAAIIYFGSILNAALIAMAERKREIATFRVLGYTPGETGAVFLRENLLTTIPGALLGIPVGMVLNVSMCAQYANDSFRVPPFVSPVSMVLTLLLSVLFALGAHAVIHFLILRLQWQEALSMKE